MSQYSTSKQKFGNDSHEGWYVFNPANDNGSSIIGLNDWLEKPAGRRGGVRMNGDRFEFEDGTPVKFWGINQGNLDAVPNREDADIQAARFEKYGVNCARLHKFVESIGHPQDSTLLTDEGWENLDYYSARLKEHGVYTGWSHLYHHKVKPGDAPKLLAYDEIVENLNREIYSLVNIAPDLQQLFIDLTVNMLQRRNPHTGLTYAEDPALAFIEFRNEDDIFWPSTQDVLEKCPTYKKRFCEYFSDWLLQKYGSQAELEKAWGARALNAYPEFMQDESLEKRNIYPIAHFWWYGRVGLAKQSEGKGTRQRLLDTARFLYEFQNDFYSRFEKAIRDTGYLGPLVGSCWQAGDGISHYYNLYSDYLVGLIDRHNYFGGTKATGSHLHPGPIDNRSMLSQPGSGYFSAGMQQVVDRPFALSEWIHVQPNEWNAEGPAIVAVYGMGLQGWDGSYHFAINETGFSDTVNGPRLWNASSPTQIGLYPALARMVYRGDVQEGAVISTRKVSLPELATGDLGFEEEVAQDGDVKMFSGDVPVETLAAGRVVVEFTEEPEATVLADIGEQLQRKSIASNTGQLVWDYAEEGAGYFTVDTPGTKAVVGFAAGRRFALGEVTIEVQSEFAVVFLTARDKEATIADAKSLLVTAVARAHNTEMRFNLDRNEIEAVGSAPILMEPVRASFELQRGGEATVHVLDHDGRRTGRTLSVTNGRFSIDGSVEKTMYYEVMYGE